MAKIDPYCMKRRKNYFLENWKKFHFEKIFGLEKVSKNSKFWKKIEIFEKFQMISDYAHWSDTCLIWTWPNSA